MRKKAPSTESESGRWRSAVADERERLFGNRIRGFVSEIKDRLFHRASEDDEREAREILNDLGDPKAIMGERE